MAKLHGIKLRQSYAKEARRLAIKAGRYAHARQFKRMRKALKKLKGRLGRVERQDQGIKSTRSCAARATT